MNLIKSYAGFVGGLLLAAGIISTILYFVGYNLRILMWIDLWGATVAWAIRIGLIVAGGILFFLGKFGPLAPDK